MYADPEQVQMEEILLWDKEDRLILEKLKEMEEMMLEMEVENES